jgi:hypothetical protein
MPKYPKIKLPITFRANVVRFVERDDNDDYGYLEIRFRVAKEDLKTLQVDDWDNLQVTLKRVV